MISLYKKKNQRRGWVVVNCYTYHQSHFGAQLFLSSCDHGQSSSCSYLKFVVIFAAEQHQQLQLIIAILQVAILHLKHTEFISFSPTCWNAYLLCAVHQYVFAAVLTSLHVTRLHMHSVAANLICSFSSNM